MPRLTLWSQTDSGQQSHVDTLCLHLGFSPHFNCTMRLWFVRRRSICTKLQRCFRPVIRQIIRLTAVERRPPLSQLRRLLQHRGPGALRIRFDCEVYRVDKYADNHVDELYSIHTSCRTVRMMRRSQAGSASRRVCIDTYPFNGRR